MSNNISKDTRTSKVVKNVSVGIAMQFIVLILSFINRTYFIKVLGNDYLSINGLYSNILNILAFAELGFGTALIYMMYKPVAENNKKKIQIIFKFYKKVFIIIGTVMFLLGLLVIPFLQYIIKEQPNVSVNLNLVYILFLSSTCIGYYFAHNTAIINANQNNYIITFYNQLGKMFQSLIQIILLIYTKNYILYLVVQIIMTLFSNICISIKARKLYPYIKEKNIPDLDDDDKKIVKSKVKSLVLYKLGPAILNGTDNLILSACVGLSSVGIYSNYYLITNYLNLFLNQITSSLETSVGNLNATDNVEQKEFVFYKLLYLCFIIYGFMSVMLMTVMNDFIGIWIGDDYLFSTFIVFSIVLYNYAHGIHFPCSSYRTTAALFDKIKYIPIVEVVLNIALSILMAYKIGVAGVFLATTISKMLTFVWADPLIIYKYLFKNDNIFMYFKKYIYYFAITISLCLFNNYLAGFFPVHNLIGWFVKSMIFGIFTLGIFILLTFKMQEYKEFKYIVSIYFNKIFKKIKID